MLKGLKTNPKRRFTFLSHGYKNLVLIECKCGAEILLLPDLKEMNHAIETHVAKHKKMAISSKRAKINIRRISQYLREQVIIKAAWHDSG
jgi:hypothetical protein